jgi:ribosome maturation protein SDO1
MVDVDKAVIARLRKEGYVFEILVDCDNALAFKKGKSIGLGDVVATDDIFKDVKKGDKASEQTLQSIFDTSDPDKIAEIIVREGEVQLTSQHRAKEREEKKKRIINIIHRNAIDSKTGLPHPSQRIENAMAEAGVHVDEHKKAEDQVEEVLKKIRVVIPIKFERREIAVKIPAQFAGQSYTILKKHKLIKDEWQNDGSLVAVVEIPAGVQDEFFHELNKLSHGDVETKIVKTIE